MRRLLTLSRLSLRRFKKCKYKSIQLEIFTNRNHVLESLMRLKPSLILWLNASILKLISRYCKTSLIWVPQATQRKHILKMLCQSLPANWKCFSTSMTTSASCLIIKGKWEMNKMNNIQHFVTCKCCRWNKSKLNKISCTRRNPNKTLAFTSREISYPIKKTLTYSLHLSSHFEVAVVKTASTEFYSLWITLRFMNEILSLLRKLTLSMHNLWKLSSGWHFSQKNLAVWLWGLIFDQVRQHSSLPIPSDFIY